MTSRSQFTRLAGLLALVLTTAGCGQAESAQGPDTGARESCAFDDDAQSMALAGDDLEAEAGADLNRALPDGLVAVPMNRRQSPGATHLDFEYRAAGVSLCGARARAHYVDGRLFVEGRLSISALDFAVWSSPTLSFDDPESVLVLAASSVGAETASLRSAARCLLIEDGRPVGGVSLSAWLDGRPYLIVGRAGRLESLEPRWFEATGEAQVYQDNPRNGRLATVPLTDLVDGNRLRSTRFATELAPGFELAQQDDRRYVYEPSDPRFVEVSMFANAERMASWFQKPEHDYSMRCVPISLQPHVVFRGGSVNNGAYVPPEETGTGYPAILLGDGDGVQLTNLAVDFDPVAHELGHHVIYRRLKSHHGESGILHEGVADYFVAAATGNTCLGESVCPKGGLVCAQDGQCLRNAANDLRFDQDDLPIEAHLRGQIISGMLWDLGNAGLGNDLLGGQDWVAATTMKAIDYLGESSGIGDFIKAMMAADLELAGGRNACQIMAGAERRGFNVQLAGISCDDYVAR